MTTQKLKNSKWGKTQKLKMWQNCKTQNFTKFIKSKCDKNQKNQNEIKPKKKATQLKNSDCDKTH